MKTLEKLWTYEDYLKLEDEKRYEIIEGELCEIPVPSLKHQDVLRNMSVKFTEYVMGKGHGRVYFSPVDAVLSENTVLQPDLVVVLKDNFSILQERGIFGAPDLVVEVVSPFTFKKDTEDKRKLYARHGVKEFWLVFPEEKVVEVLTLKKGQYEVFSHASEKGRVCSKILEGFCLKLEGLFL